MIDLPSEPMLANPVETFALPLNWFAEPKWDGFRAFAAHDATGPTVLRSRTGSDLSAAFPEITSALRRLPFSVVFDGELVVWEENRLAFGRLTQRLHRRGAVAQQAAAAQPAHYVVFDLLHVEGQSLRERSYVERRRALETLFQREGLAAPWTLCPSTNDAEVARGWLAWSVAGVEGCVFKDGGESYRPGERSWRKFRVRDTLEMIVGAVTGAPHRPRTLLLGRHDFDGRLQYAGRTSALPGVQAQIMGGLLRPVADHPWAGWSFSAGWGSREKLQVSLVVPETVVEISVDVSRDARGRLRHPVRFVRVRADMAVEDVPPLDALRRPAT
ncbi:MULTISPECIES: ATP-dependent DNA ligase [Streptomyces]|uniref:Putative ATP-dependent DNA ligase n=1 Tax=Streptomyces turgidiscabies (strain Car8) TaxID=698760 RepID=L7F6M4_STRT8|nr:MULTISPECIES: ATP-dependent DNA ligase [Streptomyces]ELP66310.1 putative ATP-dependent DNA ligase [Streptomyces turgidiscabies Car8]MDX3499282.1 ATP-dependent DNA ligase [Streptomyces turgidiscabies]